MISIALTSYSIGSTWVLFGVDSTHLSQYPMLSIFKEKQLYYDLVTHLSTCNTLPLIPLLPTPNIELTLL